MRVLLTNDDGIEAEGLQALRRALLRARRTSSWRSSPPTATARRSARSITTRRPLWVEEVDFERRHASATRPTARRSTACAWRRSGSSTASTPTSSSSGINHGSNLGDDITYSGTVAAALEGIVLGLPAHRRLAAVRRRARWTSASAAASTFDDGGAVRRRASSSELDDVPLPAGHAAEHQRPRGRARRRRGHAAGQAHLPRRAQARRPRTRTAAAATGSTAPTRASTTSRAPTSPPSRAGHIAVTPLHFDLTDASGIDALAKHDLARLLAPAAQRRASERRVRRTSARAPRSCATELRHHGHRYYVLDDPEIGDDDYDALLDELRAHRGRAPRAAHARLADPARRRRAGRRACAKVTHQLPMLSLANARSEEELRAWVDAHAQPPRARGHRGPGVRATSPSRRSTAWRSRCSTGTACSSAARRAATARSARTSRTTCARSPTIPLRIDRTTRRRCSRCAARSTCRCRTSPRSTSAAPRPGCRRS